MNSLPHVPAIGITRDTSLHGVNKCWYIYIYITACIINNDRPVNFSQELVNIEMATAPVYRGADKSLARPD